MIRDGALIYPIPDDAPMICASVCLSNCLCSLDMIHNHVAAKMMILMIWQLPPRKECSHKFHLPQRSKPEPVQMWQMLARGPQIAHCATGEPATMGSECVRKLIQLPFQPANPLLTSLRGLIKAQR